MHRTIMHILALGVGASSAIALDFEPRKVGGGLTAHSEQGRVHGENGNDPPCPADFNGDGVLNVFDFLVFQNFYTDQRRKADLNADGVLNVFDFLLFQNLFTEGC